MRWRSYSAGRETGSVTQEGVRNPDSASTESAVAVGRHPAELAGVDCHAPCRVECSGETLARVDALSRGRVRPDVRMGGLPGPTIDLNLTVRIAGLPGSAAERHRRATPGTHQDSIRIAFLRGSPAGVEARQPRRFASSATVTGFWTLTGWLPRMAEGAQGCR